MAQGKSNMSIESFVNVAVVLPTDTSVLLRGDHGIGKSQVVREVGRQREAIDGIKRKVIDRRLAQMTEGDMLGLPSTDGKTTRWNPMEWFHEACESPCILLLDELNRANTEIMQAAFQIVLDREIDGKQLHPNTLVYAAINTSAAYTVNEVDPALLDRFFVVDLNPTVGDWLRWANSVNPNTKDSYVDSVIVEFIRGQEKWLDTPKDADPQAVTTSRRSWERLSNALRMMEIIDNPGDPRFYSTCLGYVGTEAAIAFRNFAKNFDRQITAEDIINAYKTKKVQRKFRGADDEVSHDILNACVEKVSDHIVKKMNRLTDKQGTNIAAFMKDLPQELRIVFWANMVKCGVDKIELSKDIHKHCGGLVLEVFGVPPGEQGIGVTPNIPGLFQQDKDKK